MDVHHGTLCKRGWMQVVHFDTEIVRPENAWTRGTNRFLPPDIAVPWDRGVPNGPAAGQPFLALRGASAHFDR